MKNKNENFDQTAALVVVVAAREQLIEEIEKAIEFNQSGNAGRALQALRGFDRCAEILGILDDHEWERQELSDKVLSILSLPWKEA